ncbi:hypothetical protein [Actinoplanes hulinensis]|uniref:hypothetical protein n=1 Tax=Actinoplanes hulinensis TaxID=1144547 RepID=UPI001FEBAE9F|nr:hypothetical protein [Actinoplanes hulinensis]
MSRIRPAIEVPLFTEPPPPWPVAAAEPWSWLPLDGDLTDEQTGLFVAVIAGGQTLTDLLDEETIIVPGGLVVDDSIHPGCCCGLEDWREWLDLLDGGHPWLGHSPDPVVEHRGGTLRVWQDGKTRDRYADIPRTDLFGMLRQVHRDLNAFLAVLGRWVAAHGADPALVTLIDQSLQISAPLGYPDPPGWPAAPPTPRWPPMSPSRSGS